MMSDKAEEYFCPFIKGRCKGKDCMFWYQKEKFKDDGYCNIPVNISD